MKGVTFYICLGKYGGFRCVWDAGMRITLGWIGIAIVLFDLECAMKLLYEQIDELKSANQRPNMDGAKDRDAS
jgi:hypothetical protein